MAFIFSALAALLLTANLPTSSAQSCPLEGPLYFAYVQGTCNSDPSNPANLQIQFQAAQPWSTHLTVNARATFRGTNGALQIYTGFPQTTWAANGANIATMNFDVPLSVIPAGSVVTHRISLTQGSSCFWVGSASYTQIHQATAKTTDWYTTITTTIPATTTTTSVLVETAIATSTPPEVTATSITGYKTLWAKRVTSTKTSTVTPRPCTKYSIAIVKTTTTVTCLGGGNHKRALDERRQDLLAVRQAKTYEMPDCFPVRTTTIYTSTIVVPATTTTTETAVAYTTETTTQTVEAPTPTSYTSVRGTTTLTPTRIVTRWSILRPSVVTSTKVFTVVVTKFPGNKIPKKCTSTRTKPTPVGAICTPSLDHK